MTTLESIERAEAAISRAMAGETDLTPLARALLSAKSALLEAKKAVWTRPIHSSGERSQRRSET